MRTALLWNTFGRDIEWFRYSAASFGKFAKGRWDEVACLVPTRDRHLFEATCDEHDIRLIDQPEWPGQGFNWHQMKQCGADLIFPKADAIWHMDADCVFTAPVSPQTWIRNDKLVISFYTFAYRASLNAWGPAMWKSRVDEAIGGSVPLSVMTGHPHAFYREVYAATRKAVEQQHPQTPWDSYIRLCQNEYPQGFCEFETLGAIAQREFPNRYDWNNLQLNPHPSTGFVAEGWSHGGLDFVSDRFDGKKTARQVFTELGL